MNGLEPLPFSTLAEINPPSDWRHLGPETEVSFVPMADVTESGQWAERRKKPLSQVNAGYTVFSEGDVLFAKITPCMENGKGAHMQGLANGIGFGSSEFHVIRAKGNNSARFLYHWLHREPTRVKALSYMGGSAGQQRVQAEFFDHLRIPQIQPAEQTRIARILDTADALIAKSEAVIAKLRQVRSGLLHDLLTRGLDAHGHLRDPATHPEPFKDSPLGRIPKEWEVKNCSQLCREIVVGIVVKPAQYYVSSGVPVLRSANLKEDGIQLTDLVYISSESNELLSKSMLRAGDLVTVRTGYPGTTCVIPDDLDGCNCVDLVISRPGPGIDARYLAHWINSPFGKDQVLRVQGGLAQQHFNVGEMRELLVATPNIEEQKRIISLLATHDRQLASEQATLSKLRQLKSGLMTDLLEGRVRVPEII